MKNSQSFFKKLNWKIDGCFLGFGTSPEADWKIIFVSTIILIALVGINSIMIFIKIDKGEIFVVERSVEQGRQTLDISQLRETVSYYQTKAQNFEMVKNQTISSPDPSL